MMNNCIYLLIFLLVAVYATADDVVDINKIIKQEPEVTIEEVVSSPKDYHKKKILVEGKVNKVKFARLPNGKEYTAFELRGKNKNELNVYTRGFIEGLDEGLNVRIYGKYRDEKKYFFKTFKNVVKAKKVLILSTVALNQ